jgi:hypothetical protein
MWCLNDTDTEGRKINKKLFGPDDGKPHRRIDLIYKPCMPPAKTELNAEILKKAEGCMYDIKDEAVTA